MFESSLHAELSSDSALAATVSVFKGAPSIFNPAAPDKAPIPYIVFRIDTTPESDTCAIKKFNINIDYFDYSESSVKCNAAVKAIEDILNRATLTHDDFGPIRVFLFSGGLVPEADPRSIHYNCMYFARSGLKRLPRQFN